MKSVYRCMIAVSTCTMLSGAASAVQIIGNMPGNDGSSTFMNAPSGGSNGGGVYDCKAAGFAMPAGAPYTLDSVVLRLEFFSTASVPLIAIYDNVGTNPGSLLHTLANPTISVGIGNFTFTPTSTFTLNASTTYWVVVLNNAPVANSFRWLASSPSVAPTGIASNAGYRFNGTGGPPPVNNSTTLNTYAVNATPVPEPATMVALGLGALVAVRRRRK